MFKRSQVPRAIRRSTTLAGFVGATVLLSLMVPSAAQAAESQPNPSDSIQATELTPDELNALSERQISIANRGTEKFSSGDLIAKVREEIAADREAREKKRAEEAAIAKAKAEAEAKAKAEAEAAAKAEAEKKAAEEAKRPSSNSSAPSAPAYTGGGSKDEWLRASGIAESDWAYVDYIVNRESSWNPNAVNASSGASGLVQALPCGKVPGSCFNPVDNLKWADGYAKNRYGSWAQAYDFWINNHWW